MEVTQSLLKSLFSYREDGVLLQNGRPVGRLRKDGYVRVHVNGRRYYAHRLIFMWHHGYMPEFIDHIDEDKTNNRIDNLREATSTNNHCNIGLIASNTSGYKGVSWDKKKSKWLVKVQFRKKQHFGGYYDDAFEAHQSAISLRSALHGEFANDGVVK